MLHSETITKDSYRQAHQNQEQLDFGILEPQIKCPQNMDITLMFIITLFMSLLRNRLLSTQSS